MVQVNFTKKYVQKLNKLVQTVLPKEDKRRNEKILAYLRIYTNLINAGNILHRCKRCIDYCKVVKRSTREFNFKEEEPYMKRINELVSGIVSDKRWTRSGDLQIGDPSHVRTKLLVAQNICVLRILKISQ